MKRTLEMVEKIGHGKFRPANPFGARGGGGYKPNPKRVAAWGKDLEIRQKVRDRERELGVREIGLPSEDSIMDHPGKYRKKMQKALKLLDDVEKAKKAYEGFSAY